MRISIIEDRKERRLVLEGKLIWPWTTEVKSAYKKARENLGGRELVVDLKNLTIIACGLMVAPALEAAEELAKSGVQARVLDMHTIKPLDDAAVRAAGAAQRGQQLSGGTGAGGDSGAGE